MLLLNRSWMAAIAAGLAIAGTACKPKTTARPVGKENKSVVASKHTEMVEPIEEPAAGPTAKAEHKTVAHKPKPQAPPPPPTIPKVAMSVELRATCVVNVGDTMPEAELPDPTGKIHALDNLYGQKLTVVSFWRIGTTHHAREALNDLMKEVAEPFGEKGVRVVGINVGDAVSAVQQEFAQASVTFPNLLDPKGEFFAKIAKDKRMPRTFLLDAGGRILWFDVEYRRQSREDLIQSIRVALGEM